MHLKFEEVQANDDVFHWGMPGQTFYIIIKGLVSIKVPNKELYCAHKFNMKRREYMNLIEWKTNDWDPKVLKI